MSSINWAALTHKFIMKSYPIRWVLNLKVKNKTRIRRKAELKLSSSTMYIHNILYELLYGY